MLQCAVRTCTGVRGSTACWERAGGLSRAGITKPVCPLSKDLGPNLMGGTEESRAPERERRWPHGSADVLGLRVALILSSARADVSTNAPSAGTFLDWLR